MIKSTLLKNKSKIGKLKTFFTKELRREVKNEIIKEYKHTFKTESFDGKKWKARKDELTHKMLNKTGKMKKATRFRVHRDRVEVTNKTEYAGMHNEGYYHIPQRQFIGESKRLNKRIEELISNEIKKIFK